MSVVKQSFTTDTGRKESGILFKPKFIRMLPWSGGTGIKGQTRRLMKPQPKACVESFQKSACPRHHLPQLPIRWPGPCGNIIETTTNDMPAKCPHGGPGDLLYVKEAFSGELYASKRWDMVFALDGEPLSAADDYCPPVSSISQHFEGGTGGGFYWYTASAAPHLLKKEHARIWLEIVSIRAERIQDISEGDAMVEGVSGHFDVVESGPHGATAVSDYRTGFKHMWTKIYGATGPKSWDANPWVWAISFKEGHRE